MILRRSLVIPLILTSLTVVGTVFLSNTAYAADPPAANPSTTSTTETAQQYGERVLKDAPATLERCGVATGVSYYYCGGTALADGTDYYGLSNFRVDYKKGDVLKCYIANVTLSDTASVCAITHDGATTYQEGFFSGATQTCTGSTCSDAGALDNATKQIAQPVTDAVSAAGDYLLKGVASLILMFSNFLLGVAGAMLNFVVYYTVFKFGSIIGNSPGVLVAWGILRDIANMLLLFGFIFLGVATILNTDKFPTRRAIPQLLIFAVLMNFSLFACEAVIDVTNGMSSLIYTQADPTGTQCLAGATNADGTSCSFLNYGIAGHIMQSTGLSSIWQNANASPSPAAMLGLAVFATIGAIVCFAAAIMLVVRLVTLTFLMVASPIGFAGMAIPFFQKFASDWWNRVIHQSFFAPIMFLLMFISLKIADTFTSGSGGVNGGLAGSVASGLGSAVTNPSTDTVGIILIFMLVCGFLLASVIVAHRFGAMGAQGAIGFSKKIVLGGYGWAGRTAGGVAGRNSIGRVSNFAQKKYNASVATGSLRFLAGGAIDEAIGNTLQKGKEAKFGSTKSFKSEQEHHEARDKELKKIERLQGVKTAANDDQMREALKKLSDAEIAESEALKKGGEQLESIARTLSSEKFDKLMGSDKISDGRKDEMRNARFKSAGAIVEEAEQAADELKKDPTDAAAKDRNDVAKKALANMAASMTGKDIGQMAQSGAWSHLLEDDIFVGSLSDDQFKDGQKNTNLNADQITRFAEVRNKRISDTGYIAQQVGGMNADAINKIKSEALSNKTVLDAMSGRKIALIDTKNIANDAHIDDIVNYIKSTVLTDAAKKASFMSAYKGDPRIEKRWQAYGIK